MHTRFSWIHSPKAAILGLLSLVVIMIGVVFEQQLERLFEEKQAFEHTSQLIHFSRAVSNFVHESQKERGLSAGYIGSSGQTFSEQLQKQRLQTDQTYSTLLATQQLVKNSAFSITLNEHIQHAQGKHSQLLTLRKRVDQLSMHSQEIIKFFNEFNAEFLLLVQQAAREAPNGILAIQLNDYGITLRCKEWAGIERATVSAAYGTNRFLPGSRDVVLEAIVKHNACFDYMLQKFSTEKTQLPTHLLNDLVFEKVKKLENAVLADDFSAGAENWFNVMTDKINLLKKIDESLSEQLLNKVLSEQKNSLQKMQYLIMIGLSMVFMLIVIIYWFTQRSLVAVSEMKIAATVFEANSPIIITDSQANILQVNRAFETLTGYSRQEVIGKTPAMLKSGLQTVAVYRGLWQTLLSEGSWQGELLNRRKDGSVYAEWLNITSIKDQHNKTTHYIGIATDITEQKEQTKKIHQLAFYDPLTQLPNRRLLIERLESALRRSEAQHQYGLIGFIDLDHFKVINDTEGHAAGDHVLRKVAEQLASCLKSDDTLARFGGDEFVILIERLAGDCDHAMREAQALSSRLLQALDQQHQFGDRSYRTGGSIGIALFYNHEKTSDQLLAEADTAMYQAKSKGRHQSVIIQLSSCG